MTIDLAETLSVVARFVLAGVLLVSGSAKVADRSGVLAAVRDYQILPTPLVPLFARSLPWLELGLGAALVVGVAVRPVAVLTCLVLLLFSAAIVVNLRRGRAIGCGCGLGRQTVISRRLVARNAGLAVAALVVALVPAGVLVPALPLA